MQNGHTAIGNETIQTRKRANNTSPDQQHSKACRWLQACGHRSTYPHLILAATLMPQALQAAGTPDYRRTDVQTHTRIGWKKHRETDLQTRKHTNTFTKSHSLTSTLTQSHSLTSIPAPRHIDKKHLSIRTGTQPSEMKLYKRKQANSPSVWAATQKSM